MLGMMIRKRIIAVEHCVSLAVLGWSTWVMEGGVAPRGWWEVKTQQWFLPLAVFLDPRCSWELLLLVVLFLDRGGRVGGGLGQAGNEA